MAERKAKRRFTEESNKVYTYSSIENLLTNEDDIVELVEHHRTHQVPRLSELDDYYMGYNRTILQAERRKEEHMADHRAAHNHARYVSQFIVGYLTGNPITITHPKEEVLKKVTEINDLNEADALNSELTLDCSIYGRAYELVYRNQKDENRVTLLSPKEAFVVYDDTVEQNPLAGIRYRDVQESDKNYTVIDLYTEGSIFTYHATNGEKKSISQENDQKHYFSGVPINEYQNNRFRQGDFENVLDLIDLYDAAQSDTANYMTDLNDAMLKIVGNVDMDFEEAKKQKNANMLILKPGQQVNGTEGKVDADYIYKKYDVSGVESYKSRVETDIHKFTNTPDMNDENFAGQQTGEAMKYKLFGLEQVRATKERFFKRSLSDRYRLLNNLMSSAKELDDGVVEDLSFTFTPNLPKSTGEAVKMFNELGGELSELTKLSLLPFVEDPQEEKDRIEEERKQQRQPSSFMEN